MVRTACVTFSACESFAALLIDVTGDAQAWLPTDTPDEPSRRGLFINMSSCSYAHLTPRRSMTVIAISVSCAIGVFGLLCAIWKCRLKRGKGDYTCDFPALCASPQLCCFLCNLPRLVHSVVKGENPSYKAKNEAFAQPRTVPW